MSARGRSQTRARALRRMMLVAGALVLLALLFVVTGHWILAVVAGVPAAVAVWVAFQARSVR